MDYEEAWAELENFPGCEDCDWNQNRINELVGEVRDLELKGKKRECTKAKKRLTFAVEAQQLHQREHELGVKEER